MDTLVLNSSYLPISRVSWQRAITLVVAGRAAVVEEYDDRFIRSPSQVFHMPSVVRFGHQVSWFFKGRVKFSRKNVWLRDKGRCQYCHRKVSLSEFTFDHVVPRNLGGRTYWENIVVSCHPCNQRKRNRTPEQAGLKMSVPPVKPRSLPGMQTAFLAWAEDMPPSWQDYLGSYRYWHVKLDEDSH